MALGELEGMLEKHGIHAFFSGGILIITIPSGDYYTDGSGFVFNADSVLVKFDNVHNILTIIIDSIEKIIYNFWEAKAAYFPLSDTNLNHSILQ